MRGNPQTERRTLAPAFMRGVPRRGRGSSLCESKIPVIANQRARWCGNPPVIRFNRGILTSGSALLRMTDDFGMAISPIHIKYRFPLDNGAGLCYSFLRILTESERLHER